MHQQTSFSIWHNDFIIFCPCVPERWSLDTTTPQAIVNGINGVKYRQVSQVTLIIIQKHLQTIHIWCQQRIAEPTFMLYVRKFHFLRISGLSVSIWLASFGNKRCPRYTGRIQQTWAAPRKAQDIKAFLAFFFVCLKECLVWTYPCRVVEVIRWKAQNIPELYGFVTRIQQFLQI